MTNDYKFFIGNWKMFGNFSSIKILNSINTYINKNKKKKFKVVFCIPSTLIRFFSSKLIKSDITVGAQNCHHLNRYGPYTGSINSKMLKNAGAKFIILGHSENRNQGENNKIINKKIKSAIQNNFTVIFCIGENIKQKKNTITNNVLSKQIDSGLKLIKSLKKIIIAYEPIWSIGTGMIPNNKELNKTISFIRNKLSKKFKNKKTVKIIYGGSVNSKNIKELKNIQGINGFLIGGASQSGKNFIDIIKNCYM